MRNGLIYTAPLMGAIVYTFIPCRAANIPAQWLITDAPRENAAAAPFTEWRARSFG